MKSIAIPCILAISLLLLAAGVIEKWRHRRNLAQIPIRILVNGTRGKTSVTRLIAAILREAGIRTWAKTTGTQAAWILPDGSERAYRKGGPVTIREQVPFIRKARMDRAQAVVIECMALHPENQVMMAEEFVRPTLQVMTNARVDHVSEIGATEQQTVETLALSIHPGAVVISDDSRFDAYTAQRVDARDVALDDGYIASFSYPTFEANVRQAFKAAAVLRIDRQTALNGMRKARPDIGMCGPFRVGHCLVINAFAANDLQSSRLLYEASMRRYGLWGQPVWVLFNNREDREFRLKEFAPLIRELSAAGAKLRVIGNGAGKAARYFARHAGAQAEKLSQTPLCWLQTLGATPCAVLCLGNIRGIGRETIEALQALDTADEHAARQAQAQESAGAR